MQNKQPALRGRPKVADAEKEKRRRAVSASTEEKAIILYNLDRFKTDNDLSSLPIMQYIKGILLNIKPDKLHKGLAQRSRRTDVWPFYATDKNWNYITKMAQELGLSRNEFIVRAAMSNPKYGKWPWTGVK